MRNVTKYYRLFLNVKLWTVVCCLWICGFKNSLADSPLTVTFAPSVSTDVYLEFSQLAHHVWDSSFLSLESRQIVLKLDQYQVSRSQRHKHIQIQEKGIMLNLRIVMEVWNNHQELIWRRVYQASSQKVNEQNDFGLRHSVFLSKFQRNQGLFAERRATEKGLRTYLFKQSLDVLFSDEEIRATMKEEG